MAQLINLMMSILKDSLPKEKKYLGELSLFYVKNSPFKYITQLCATLM